MLALVRCFLLALQHLLLRPAVVDRRVGIRFKGFPKSYVAPEPDYITPTYSDPNFEILKPVYIDPYWVASLEMDEWDAHITPMLFDFERLIEYSFPDTVPDYDTFGITGWGQATEEMKIATMTFSSNLKILILNLMKQIIQRRPT